MKRALIFLVGLAVVACSSLQSNVSDEQVLELDSVRLDSIQSLIDENRLAEAYQEISLLMRDPQDRIPNSELEELAEQVTKRIVNVFEEQVGQGEYAEAFRHYLSLVGIGKEDRRGTGEVLCFRDEKDKRKEDLGDSRDSRGPVLRGGDSPR